MSHHVTMFQLPGQFLEFLDGIYGRGGFPATDAALRRWTGKAGFRLAPLCPRGPADGQKRARRDESRYPVTNPQSTKRFYLQHI